MMQALIAKALSVPTLSWPLRYSLTSVFVLIAPAIRLLVVDPMIDIPFHHPFLLFYPAIISASLIFNHGTMVFSTLLSAFLAMFLFIEPRYSFTIATSDDLLGLLLFVGIAFAMGAVIEELRTAVVQARAAEARAQTAEGEKDLLLREVVHRVKNDLQGVATLLLVQASQITDPGTRAALQAAAERVGILGPVHTRLSQQDHRDVVNIREFIEQFALDLQAAVIGLRPIILDLDIEELRISHGCAVYLGLIINELLTNALKYAFPDNRLGKVEVRLAREEQQLVLRVRDNGVGVPPENSETTGLGAGLVRALVRTLNGTLETESGHGMAYTIRIPEDQC